MLPRQARRAAAVAAAAAASPGRACCQALLQARLNGSFRHAKL